MKQEVKGYLQEIYAAPEPERRESFMQSIIPTQIGTVNFVKSQIGYIRKRVWVMSVLIFVFALVSAEYVGDESISLISALIPFIALCAVTEGTRSVTYGMLELEMSTRFSLHSVMLARLLAIGCLHMLILGGLIPVAGGVGFLPFIRRGVYLLLPYLLTSVLGVIAVRKFQDYQSAYVCMGCAVIVSLFTACARVFLVWVYEEKYFMWWCVLSVYLLTRGYKEYKRMIYHTEDYAWN